jgi:hypothetical protein
VIKTDLSPASPRLLLWTIEKSGNIQTYILLGFYSNFRAIQALIERAMLMPSPHFETGNLNGLVAMHINSINKSHQLN